MKKKVSKLPASARKVLALSKVRSSLSPLVKQVTRTQQPVGIAVHGKVEAYLVARETLHQLELAANAPAASRRLANRKLRGSLVLVGDLDEAQRQVREEIEQSIARTTAQLLE